MTDEYDRHPDASAVEIFGHYQQKVDSIMSPVIGHAAEELTSYRPESPLSNLIADILRESAAKRFGQMPEVGIMNMGGIRNIMNGGNITIGTIYEICPFQNALSVVTMKGDVLLELFRQIASLHGEGLSGANLVISKDGKLISAKVGGKDISPAADYRVATIDYIAAGNDHMEAFKKAVKKEEPADAVLRDLFIEYVKANEAAGRTIDARVEGRIVVK